MIKYVLTDIEGTTTPITFVHDVLFPYSAQHLRPYVTKHAADPIVRACLKDTGAGSDDAAIDQLLLWIKQDNKHPALKTLQGLIWRAGYESGAYTAAIYPDVKPALEGWARQGLRLGVYSSGSVAAQKLLFRYTNEGDLTPLFSDYFDTAVGAKRERSAYEAIVKNLNLPAEQILFLSDIAAELDAAKAVGLAVTQILRAGTKASGRHPEANEFSQVKLTTAP